jgi:hypothetical protein
MKIKILLPIIAVLVVVVTGCRSNPVYNLSDAPVTTSTRNYGVGDVRGAILQAGASLGWQMKAVRPGLIVGTLHVREHMAKIEIPYDRRSYSILYQDSSNLDYDGANIHSNYNGWVQNLSKEINARLSVL